MACKENADKHCKSYPKCDGCGAHTAGNNLIVKHRFAAKTYKDGEYDNAVDLMAHDMVYEHVGNRIWASGEVTDRLHEFEKLGYEPQQLENIIKLYRIYRQAAHSQYGMCSSYQDTDSLATKRNDAIDTLWYLYKLAGDVENAESDDIRSMYPSTLVTKEGFADIYGSSKEFKKLVQDRIERVIKRPASAKKVWVTTSSSIKDDELMKKVKEAMNAVRGGFTYRAPNTFTIDELHTVPADDGWLRTLPFKVADFDRPNRNGSILKYNHCYMDTLGKVNNVEQDKEGIKMNVIFKNTYDATKVSVVETNKALPKIKNVMFNNPATIVFWSDGDKTVVKCQNGEPYDPEKGLAMAISKKALGNGRGYYDEFQKQLGRGRKHSTPEQFNSEVCHIQKLEDLKAAEEDNKTNCSLAADALDYLSKAVNDPKSTKLKMDIAIKEAIHCINAILANY